MDNTAKEIEVVAERRNNKSLYQFNKVTVSQFTLSGNANNKQKKNLKTEKKTQGLTFQILAQQASQDTSPMRLHSQS